MAVALLSFVGVLGGAIIGVRVAPLLAEGIEQHEHPGDRERRGRRDAGRAGRDHRRVPRPPGARPHHRRALPRRRLRRSARSCRRSRWSWRPGWSRCRWPRRACPAGGLGGARRRRCSARSTRSCPTAAQAAPGRAAPPARHSTVSPTCFNPFCAVPRSRQSPRRTRRWPAAQVVANSQRAVVKVRGSAPTAAPDRGFRLRLRRRAGDDQRARRGGHRRRRGRAAAANGSTVPAGRLLRP